jgi:hypothetical protein
VNLEGFAGAVRELAERADGELASTCAEEAGKDFLAILRVVTPKRSGRLAASEKVDAVTGGGAEATAVVGAHTVYAAFREHGGTITRKLPLPHVLGTPETGFFGHSVSQAGSHYFEKAEGLSKGPIAAACLQALNRFLTL